LGFGTDVGIGGERGDRTADGIGVPDHVRAGAGREDPIKEALMVVSAAIGIELGVQLDVRLLGIDLRPTREDAA
jgi:hypothetical protein